jgi:hypothetical protein
MKGFYLLYQNNVPIPVPVHVTDTCTVPEGYNAGDWLYLLADDLSPHFFNVETTTRGLWIRSDDPQFIPVGENAPCPMPAESTQAESTQLGEG